jgi:hypothetical protein
MSSVYPQMKVHIYSNTFEYIRSEVSNIVQVKDYDSNTVYIVRIIEKNVRKVVMQFEKFEEKHCQSGTLKSVCVNSIRLYCFLLPYIPSL